MSDERLKNEVNDALRNLGARNKCPAGKVVHETLAVGKWMTLNDLKIEDRKKLAKQFTTTQE